MSAVHDYAAELLGPAIDEYIDEPAPDKASARRFLATVNAELLASPWANVFRGVIEGALHRALDSDDTVH